MKKMIKFFRNIRKKLAIENKAAAYSRYAIGEIVLVVIGILIALQINNWNEHRKQTEELREYLYKISNNVKQDIEQVEGLKIRRDTVRAKAIRSAKALMSQDFSNIEDILQGQRVFYEFYFIPDKSGFEALKNSQFLGKINNTKVDSLLTHYYSLVEKIHKAEESYNVFIENMEAQLSINVDRTPLNLLFERRRNGEDVNINEYHDILPYIQDNAFKSAVFRTLGERTYLGYYPKLIETGTALIEEINSFCDTND